MLRLVIFPNVVALLNVASFHADWCSALWPRIAPRASWAKTFSWFWAIGSNQGVLKSRACESASSLISCCRSSRRSLAKDAPARAARFRDPSGALTILTGLNLSVCFVWPLRKAGSSSLTSTSNSSSTSAVTLGLPKSSSRSGYSFASIAPDAMSCLISQRSGDVSRFAERIGLSARPFEPRGMALDDDRCSWARRASSAISASDLIRRCGVKSRPVAWSTSLIERLTRSPATLMTFTLTD